MKKIDVLIDSDALRWLDRALRYLEHEIDFAADDEAIEFNDGKVTLEIIQNAFKSVTNIEPELVDQMELNSMSYTFYLLAINLIVWQILVAMPETTENVGRLAFAMLVSFIVNIALLIKGGKELWVDLTKKE